MSNRFLISAATIALMAGTGFANAQGTGMGREQGGAAVQQSAPSTGNSAAPSNRQATEPSGSSSGMKSTQSEQKPPAGAAKSQRTEENVQGQKSKSMSSENETKAGKDTKAEGREGRGDNMKAEGREGRGDNMKAEGREGRGDNMKAEGREGRDGNKNAQNREGRDQGQNAQNRDRNGNMNAETKGTNERSQTTGQAGAGAKLSSEQRTKITTVFRSQRVEPANNVNFSISVGTRVPREGVSFRPLPTEVVSIYPEWRGYEFILVRNQIVVVDPATYEIVAILDV
jgi:hypothetical protein